MKYVNLDENLISLNDALLTSLLSQPTMSPHDTSLHTQYRGSLGSYCQFCVELLSSPVPEPDVPGKPTSRPSAVPLVKTMVKVNA